MLDQGQSAKKGTSILFVNPKDQVLLLLRDNEPHLEFPNCWDIPGGNVEGNETPDQSIIREMLEEIGKYISSPKLYKESDMGDRYEYTYWAKADWNTNEILLTEGQGLKWFTEQDVRKLKEEKIAFGFKETILQFLKDAPYK